MGAFGYVANLSDRVRVWEGLKFGEASFYFQARDLLDLIIG
jgi:hypothetical protein